MTTRLFGLKLPIEVMDVEKANADKEKSLALGFSPPPNYQIHKSEL